jgi:PAS domain S-box-containing protein
MKIFMLEDNPTDAGLTIRILKKTWPGCEINHITTISEAKETLAVKPEFDVALLDMQLPDGNGLDILMEIRQKKLDMAVAMLTGSGDEEVAVAALKAGADDYTVKQPGYTAKVPQSVEQAIENHRQYRKRESGAIHVLYIEHNAADVDFTQRHLTRYAPFIRLTNVPNGEKAMKLLPDAGVSPEEWDYQLILMDYRLPGMNALEIIKEIRHERKLDIPILIVTGHGNEEVAVQALKVGASDYLVKRENYLTRLPSLITGAYQNCELKRKQKALAESESKYRLLAENSGDVIFTLDFDLNYTYISPAIYSMRGFLPEEIVGTHISKILTTASFKKAKEIFIEVLPQLQSGKVSPKPMMIELETYKKDGSTIWVEVKVSASTDREGNPVGILGVSRDVSKRKAVQEQLIEAKEKAEAANRLKTAFLNNISHEVRTPLNGILGFGQFIVQPGISQAEKDQFLNILQKSSYRLINTITAFMDISLITSGNMQVLRKMFPLQLWLNEVIELIEPHASEKGLEIKITPDPDLLKGVEIESDPELLKKVFFHLADNAVKFTKEGTITLGCRVENDILHGTVEDTGVGIETGMQKTVFEHFTQADSSNSRGYEGSGLGLSIAKGLVELLGGEISLESEKGRGTRGEFSVPVSNFVETAKKERLNGEPFENDALVLIAEDDAMNRFFVEVILEKAGIPSVWAENGLDAVSLCKSNSNIGLVLMDLKMPVLDGLEATRQIKSFKPELPVIATTAQAMKGDEKLAINAGCDEYLSKPFKHEVLVQKIRTYLGNFKKM